MNRSEDYFDNQVYPQPLYKPGAHIVSLHRPGQWYIKRALSKGKTPGTTNVEVIMQLLVNKTFGLAVDQEELDLALNLDCMVNHEAKRVQEEVEQLILAEIMAYFPKIAAELPEEFYCLNKMDLVINVPAKYEEQRGYFF